MYRGYIVIAVHSMSILGSESAMKRIIQMKTKMRLWMNIRVWMDQEWREKRKVWQKREVTVWVWKERGKSAVCRQQGWRVETAVWKEREKTAVYRQQGWRVETTKGRGSRRHLSWH